MTPLTDLCVSRPLAERMRSLGFEQSTQFYWTNFYQKQDDWEVWETEKSSYFSLSYFVDKEAVDRKDDKELQYISAPLAGEIEFPSFGYTLIGYFSLKAYSIENKEYSITANNYTIVANTEAEAKGLMWCHLKKNKLI